jgi:hypothetical protein
MSFDESKFPKIYGISKNPDTKDFNLVLQDDYCEECGEKYTEIGYKWCKPCQMNHLEKIFANWTSDNKEIDDFIQEMQLKINKPEDRVFEWISYGQLNDIKKTGNKVCSALWEDGPLIYDLNEKKWARKQAKEVILKFLCNSQSMIGELLNKVWKISCLILMLSYSNNFFNI